MTLKYSHNSLHIDINNVDFEIFKRDGQQRTAKGEKVVNETCALCCTNERLKLKESSQVIPVSM